MESIYNTIQKIPTNKKAELREKLKKFDINKMTPKNENGVSKRIYNCAGKELLDLLHDNKYLLDICKSACETYGNSNNMLGELLLNTRIQNNTDTMDATILSLAIVYTLYEQIGFFEHNPAPSYDELLNKVIIERLQNKTDYCERYKKKDLPSSEKRYYDGKIDMLQELFRI